MGFFNYPHTDLNQSNLDWIIGKIKDIFAGRGVVTSVNGQDGAVTIAIPQSGVSSVNGQTGDVVLTIPSTAADVGAIAAPTSPATGAFLVWDGTAWVAQTLSTWQGGSY